MPPPRKGSLRDRCCHRHFFHGGSDEVDAVRSALLSWYDANKRQLPWRDDADGVKDDDVRGYRVWVSEIMLQQTQVATVVDYYNRWMSKWPDSKSMSDASLDEVNEAWSGLGYYSRGRRLLEGAKKVQSDLGGRMPQMAKDLLKELPGVGRYTSCAVASIAYGEPVGLVDGNVVRVFSRLRVIGAEATSQSASESFWLNADTLVDPQRPGDFNQSIMELGATVCTPKNPKCSECPVAKFCKAKYSSKKRAVDIEDLVEGCELCFPKSEKFDPKDGVQNYPFKAKKTPARAETSDVVVLHDADKYVLFQRPSSGLLAGLLEFGSIPRSQDSKVERTASDIKNLLLKHVGVDAEGLKRVGDVLHKFSHINQTYVVWSAEIDKRAVEKRMKYSNEKYQSHRWLTRAELDESAISTAMKKVLKLTEQPLSTKKRPRTDQEETGARQKKITAFFNKPK